MNLNPASMIDQTNGDFQKLLEAFTVFNHASASLQASYQELQQEARRLSEELENANAELKRSLAEKESVQNYLRSILESLSNGVLVLDPDGRLTICNPAAASLLGLSAETSIANPLLADLSLPDEMKLLVEQVIQSVRVPDEDVELNYEIGEGKRKHLAISVSPIIDQSGLCSGFTIILKDTTRVKELELQTQQAQKLQAMGEMAVQLAHEIRNPLGSIELFASLLKGELEGKAELKGWAEQISTGIKFLNTIVTNMLTFARSSKLQSQRFDLRELVESTLLFVSPVLEQRNIRVEKPEAIMPLMIHGDPEMLRQMLMNLFMNALQAMPEQGGLSIRLKQESSRVLLDVEDTGIGIAPENVGRIFDPFFTTNESGTGLGLSLVHQIVERHRGEITARSEFGKGACFTISLPLGGDSGC